MSRVGMWYSTGPAEEKEYIPGDPRFCRFEVVSDAAYFLEDGALKSLPTHVTVRSQGGQEFPVPASLIDEIASR